jgi:hypothetical protein
VLQAVKGAGIWRSTVAASPRAWTHVAIGTAAASDRVLSASGVFGSASTFLMGLYAGGIWKSIDSGSTFNPVTVTAAQADFSYGAGTTAVDPFVSVWDIAASTSNANLIYAATGGAGMFYAGDPDGLMRWNGTSWGAVASNAPTGSPWNGTVETGAPAIGSQIFGVAINTSSDNIVYSSLLTGYPTPNGASNVGIMVRNATPAWGTTTTTVTAPALIIHQVRDVVTSAATPNKLVALTFDDKPIVSSNGSTFDTLATVSTYGFERIRFFSVAENPNNTGQWIGGTNKGLFTSGDGFIWSRVNMSPVFPQLVITAVGFRPTGGFTNRAFAADFAGNRFCSNNGGATWVQLAPSLAAGVNAIRVIGTNLYYLTDGAGMFQETATC